MPSGKGVIVQTQLRSVVGLGCFVLAGSAGVLPGCGTTTDRVGEDAGTGGTASGGRETSAGRSSSGGAGTTQGESGSNHGGAAQAGASERGGGSAQGGSDGRAGSAGQSTGRAGSANAGGGAGGSSDGGESGAGAGGDESTSGGAGAGGACDERIIIATPVVPTIELLVDTSGSMFETTPTTWSVLFDALMDPDAGVVKPLQHQMRFGFLSYKGHQASSETDPACATMTAVAPALDNYDAIDTVYASVGASYDPASPPQPTWETPTNYAIGYAANLLLNDTTDAGPKYILLATDGNPNTCEATDPQCGQDRAIKAAQDAYAAGIGMFVLGVGDIVGNPNSGCNPADLRCGALHLQDLANAGVGAPVHTPPNCDDPSSSTCSARYEACNMDTMLASYTTDAADVGTPFEVDTSAAGAANELDAALSSLLSGAVSCTVPLDRTVSDAARLVVTVGASVRQSGDADGWVLDADGRHVTLNGRACVDFKALQPLKLSVSCPR